MGGTEQEGTHRRRHGKLTLLPIKARVSGQDAAVQGSDLEASVAVPQDVEQKLLALEPQSEPMRVRPRYSPG